MNRNFQLLAAILVLLSVIGGVQIWSFYHEPDEVQYFGEAVAEPRSYKGRIRKATGVSPTVGDEKIKLPFHKVERHDIVFFEIDRDDFSVPIMAYITPAGRLFVGISLCEGCEGSKFSLAGKTLLSEKCRTIFNIEDHSFIRGSRRCRDYPPQPLGYRLDGDTLYIPLDEVLVWEPRYPGQENTSGEAK